MDPVIFTDRPEEWLLSDKKNISLHVHLGLINLKRKKETLKVFRTTYQVSEENTKCDQKYEFPESRLIQRKLFSKNVELHKQWPSIFKIHMDSYKDIY